jgi:hypothetical protein
MSEDIRANVKAGAKQEQPRKAPARGRGMLLYYLIGGLVLLTVAIGGIYLFKPAWLSFIGGPQDIVLESDSQIVFNGKASEITAGQGNSVVQGVPDDSRSTVIVRSQRGNARAAGTTEGAHVQLKPDVAADLSGKRVRVTVWARAAQENPTKLFGVAYSRAQGGTTGWIAFEPTNEIKPYSFAYKVPAAGTQNSTGDYIGIWSDIAGANGGLEVRLITVRALPTPPPKAS